MAPKGKEKMTPQQKVESVPPVVEKPVEIIEALSTKNLKPKQPWLNLDTFEDEEVTLEYKEYGLNSKASSKAQYEALDSMVQPESEKAKAYLIFINKREYANAKAKVLASGNYMTPQLKSTITGFMQLVEAYSTLKGSECFDRWLAGYKAKKQSAITFLERARATEELSDL